MTAGAQGARPLLFSSHEAEAATGGTTSGPAEWSVSGISIDTRILQPGDLFVALEGARDGHDFIAAAAAAGASAALVRSAPIADAPAGLSQLRVASPAAALTALAGAARDRCFGQFIAVTGSAGKTSTKDMLRAALAAAGPTHAADRSFNNHIGVPLTLASLPADAAFAVFEIGMNHAGEITPLTQLVCPHIAIVTTVAAAHLEFFDSVDGIAAAKAEIFSGVRQGGAALIPADNPYADYLSRAAAAAGINRIIGFGEAADPRAGACLRRYEVGTDGIPFVSAEIFGERCAFNLRAPGRHQAVNAMAVLAAGRLAGVPLPTLIAGLEGHVAGQGRGALRQVTIGDRTITVLDESYNANPASMRAALQVLGGLSPVGAGRRVAVLGEMRELGPDGPALHAALAEPIRSAGAALILLAGAGMEPLAAMLDGARDVRHVAHASHLRPLLSTLLVDGDVVLFKGSNASGIGALLKDFLMSPSDGD